ncbi:MAG TPA: Stp1/IreP family PP2C-type Ser/Thr phosphatase [Solirubrobacteraceae bacterium]|jgi:serine/threonine protein phosphatase PrpC|nr:Stp1/IreP family PP2C-type Ser/Thr phosphatase [Solirubrobacteraceae bacterium]
MLRVAEHWSGTDTGLQRRANEDSLLVRSPLFVVADGMGGAQAGEVASSVAVDTFRAGLEDGEDPERSLVAQVEQANSRINELSHSNAEHAGMGTTITAVYVGEQDVAIAHVGDSRAYCMRDGELLRLTDDHSLVDELIRQGKLTPEEAEEHPQRSVITRALGPEASVEVDVRSFRGRPGDVYLLCSDGLTTMVGEAELLRLLALHERLADAGEALIAAANGAGGKDNITVVLLRLEEVLSEAERPGDGHTTITAVAAVPPAPSASQERTSIPTSQADSDVAVRDDEYAEQPLSLNGNQAPAPPRRPRWPQQTSQPTKSARLRRRLRRVRTLVVLSIVVGLLAAAAYLALQSVYFIGTNQRGLVTMYNGLPYELPGKIKLYTSDYVSGVSASTLVPARRQALLDHSLRSEGDAAELMRELELGQLSEG